MTHDELLAKIAFNSAHHLREALRAVVELHKPVNTNILREKYIGCNACFGRSYEFKVYQNYPCSTIQAIEKELG
jgi:hypothetical protein